MGAFIAQIGHAQCMSLCGCSKPLFRATVECSRSEVCVCRRNMNKPAALPAHTAKCYIIVLCQLCAALVKIL